MIRRNVLTDADAAQQYIDGVRRLKDPAQFPWPDQDGLSIYDSFVFWHHQTMMLMTPPTQSDRNAAHSGPSFLPWHRSCARWPMNGAAARPPRHGRGPGG